MKILYLGFALYLVATMSWSEFRGSIVAAGGKAKDTFFHQAYPQYVRWDELKEKYSVTGGDSSIQNTKGSPWDQRMGYVFAGVSEMVNDQDLEKRPRWFAIRNYYWHHIRNICTYQFAPVNHDSFDVELSIVRLREGPKDFIKEFLNGNRWERETCRTTANGVYNEGHRYFSKDLGTCIYIAKRYKEKYWKKKNFYVKGKMQDYAIDDVSYPREFLDLSELGCAECE